MRATTRELQPARAFAADLDRRRGRLVEFARDFERRRAALGLSKKKLSELADVDETCIGRVLNGDSTPLTDTVTKIEAALVAEEKRVLSHLLALRRADKRRAAA